MLVQDVLGPTGLVTKRVHLAELVSSLVERRFRHVAKGVLDTRETPTGAALERAPTPIRAWS